MKILSRVPFERDQMIKLRGVTLEPDQGMDLEVVCGSGLGLKVQLHDFVRICMC